MPLKRDSVEEALQAKGFKKSNGDHRYFTYHTSHGKKTAVFTKTSHGKQYKELGDDLVKQMAKQCRMTTPQFKQFVACTITQSNYEKLLVDNKHIVLSATVETDSTPAGT